MTSRRSTGISFTLWLEKLRFREVKELVQGHSWTMVESGFNQPVWSNTFSTSLSTGSSHLSLSFPSYRRGIMTVSTSCPAWWQLWNFSGALEVPGNRGDAVLAADARPEPGCLWILRVAAQGGSLPGTHHSHLSLPALVCFQELLCTWMMLLMKCWSLSTEEQGCLQN